MQITTQQYQTQNHQSQKPTQSNSELKHNTRLYQVWPAKNRFILNGRLFSGPKSDRCFHYLAWFLIISIYTAFCAIVIPELWNDNSTLCILTIVLFILVCLFMIITSSTEPGIIPRNSVFQSLEQTVPFPYNIGHISLQQFQQEVDIDPSRFHQIQQSFKFCETCKIFKPPRSSHCSLCDCCVQVFDHHCPFVNNCIGKRNYQYFLSFIVFLTALLLFMMVSTFIYLNKSYRNSVIQQDAKSNKAIFTIALIIMIIIISIMIIILCLFHVVLSCIGKTTKEQLKKKQIQDELSHQVSDFFGFTQSLFNPQASITLHQAHQIIQHSQSHNHNHDIDVL